MKLRHFLVFLAAAGLVGCATVGGDSIDEEAVYRAQDQAFRPLGEPAFP